MPTTPDLYNASEQAAGRLTPAMLAAAAAAGGIVKVQQDHGLTADGKAGPATQRVLAALAAGKTPIPTGRDGVRKVYGDFAYKEGSGGRIIPDQGWVAANIRQVVLHTGGKVNLHTLAGAEFAVVFKDACTTSGYTPKSVQTWVPRHTLWDPAKSLSLHSWGIAVDFDPAKNPMGGQNSYLRTPQGQVFVKVFKAAGWTWGGDWDMKDDMHFQRAYP